MDRSKPDDHRVRRRFLTGLVALFPIIVTLFVIALAWNTFIMPVSRPVSSVVTTTIQRFSPNTPEWLLDLTGPVASIVLFIAFIYILGYAITSIFGDRLQSWMDRFFSWLPVVKFIYPHAKQLADFLFGARKVKFNRVVAIEYPRKGVYTIGFVTSGGVEKISLAHGHRMLAIFVPTSPTPFTGWTVLVDEREVLPVDMTVDQAVRYAVSCGVIVPAEAPTTILPAVKPELAPPDIDIETEN